jgi:hypothetical protein
MSYHTWSQGWLTQEIPLVSTELAKTALSFFAPYLWNNLQNVLKCYVLVGNSES